MKRFASSAALAVALLTVAGVLGTFFAKDSLAQIAKAALVKVIDEPGRNPYQCLSNFDLNTGQSIGFVCQGNPQRCTAVFCPVPAGKRLVLENITGYALVDAPSFPKQVSLDVLGNSSFHLASIPVFLLPGVTGANGYTYGVNATLHNYFEAATTPSLTVTVVGTTARLIGEFTLGGYLVDVN